MLLGMVPTSYAPTILYKVYNYNVDRKERETMKDLERHHTVLGDEQS